VACKGLGGAKVACSECRGNGRNARCGKCGGGGCQICKGSRNVSIEALLVWLQKPDLPGYAVNTIIRQLGEIGDVRAAEPLIARLLSTGKKQHDDDLGTLLRALGGLNVREIIPYCIEALGRNGSAHLHNESLGALVALKAPEGLMEVYRASIKRGQGWFPGHHAAFLSLVSTVEIDRLSAWNWNLIAQELEKRLGAGKSRPAAWAIEDAEAITKLIRRSASVLGDDVLKKMAALQDFDVTVDREGGFGLHAIDLSEVRNLSQRQMQQRRKG